MADLEGPLLSLRNDLHIATGRFIDDNQRSDRSRRSIFKINERLLRPDVSGTEAQALDLTSASHEIAAVKYGQNQKFDSAMGTVEDALSEL